MLKKYGFLLLPVMPILFIFLWQIFSVYYLDFGGVYSFELNLTTHPTCATTGLIFFSFIFLITYEYIFLKFALRNKSTTSSFFIHQSNRYVYISYYIIITFCIILFLALAAYFISTGIPLFSGENRADFNSRIEKVPILNFLYNNMRTLIFFLGYILCFRLRKQHKYIIFFFVGLFFLVLVLSGNKFSALFDLCVNFLMAPSIFIIRKKIPVTKLMLYFSLGIIVILSIVFIQSFKYSYILSDGNSNIFQYLAERVFILQGGIWWRTFFLVSIEKINWYNHLSTELQSLISSQHSGYTGLKFLMEQASEARNIYELLDYGQFMFTGGSPAIFLATFGKFFSLAVFFLFSIVFSLLLRGLMFIIKFKYLIIIYIYFCFFYNFLIMINAGEFSVFFTLGDLFRLLIILFSAIFLYTSSKKSVE
ncbi:MAG: oligosaccharide repeat unit polymerase [Bacteroidetes bacterium]|nr:oligosaccharide repeat unit polymerase [Bacteroidota bacterium]MBS1627765.1 oligosaccharide repeat unit polymerase [Bacteroidota bacterium]MBS1649826.1 oligosaccharide repeat unit polymerase [Bacteroidota bacterium]